MTDHAPAHANIEPKGRTEMMKYTTRSAATQLRRFKRDLVNLKSVWSHESLLNTKMVLFIATRINDLVCSLDGGKPKKKKSPPTAWQKFFAQGMRAGKPPRVIAQEWKAR